MTYVPQTWENLPSETTPISAERLNHIEAGIAGVDQRVFVATDPDYGASGSEIADACQAAIDAMPAEGGQLVIPAGLWTFNKRVVLRSGVRVSGAGKWATRVTSNFGHFTWTTDISEVHVEHMFLNGAGGHIFAPSGGDADHGVYNMLIRDCFIAQNSDDVSIFHHVSGKDYDNVTVMDCDLNRVGTSTVPAWYVVNSGGAANENFWVRCWARSNNCTSTPFFHLESTTNVNYAYDNRFADITGEQNPGGLLLALSTVNLIVDNVNDYDAVADYVADVIRVGASPTGGLASLNPTVRSSGRRGGTLGAGVFDIHYPAGETRRGLIVQPTHSTAALSISAPSASDGTTVLGAEPTSWTGQPTNTANYFGKRIHVPAGVLTTPVPLADAATIATDASLGDHFRVTLGGNRTLGAPSNPTDGQKVMWELVQDGTGGRTLTLGAAFALGSDIPSVTLSTAAGAVDYLGAIYRAADARWHVIALSRGF